MIKMSISVMQRPHDRNPVLNKQGSESVKYQFQMHIEEEPEHYIFLQLLL